MATTDGTKYEGLSIIDMSNVKDVLIDLPPGAMRGMRAQQAGMDEVIAEVLISTAAQREAADIPAHVYTRFTTRTAKLAELRQHEVNLAKLLEVCTETRTKMENDREDDISVMAKAARDSASRQKNAAIAAPFEKMLKYHSQIADKAVQTRKKNEEANGASEQPPAQDGGLAPPA